MENQAKLPKKKKLRVSRRLTIILLLAATLIAGYFIFRNTFFQFRPGEETESDIPLSSGQEISFDFGYPSALRGWREYAFNKKSEYKIEPDEYGEMTLHATSKDAYSTIFKIVNVPIETRPVLSWQWRVKKFPDGKTHSKLGADGENDFAIRVCAVFTKNNPFASDVIQYVWDDHFPEDTADKSPYKKSVRIIVAHSGAPQSKEWVEETRDLAKDYERVFGKPPQNNLRAVSIITSSDDLHTETEAYVRKIEIKESVVPVPEQPKWRFDLGKGISDAQKNVGKILGKLNPKFLTKYFSLPWKRGRKAQTLSAPADSSGATGAN